MIAWPLLFAGHVLMHFIRMRLCKQRVQYCSTAPRRPICSIRLNRSRMSLLRLRPIAAAMRAPPPSKLLPSPGRSRELAAAVPSLSSSRSRRLRRSGGVKGGQSPMFPSVAGGRRKGVAFEAAEPTSPKVTCIGQVRVKSMKKKAAPAAAVVRSTSVRGRGTEASFRRVEDGGGSRGCFPSRNHEWAHRLPVRINCFFPCGGRPLCSSFSSSSGEERGGKCGEDWWSSNAAVLARWPVSVPQSEEEQELGFDVEVKKRKEVMLVVGKGEVKEEEVQVSIPPRNALLLMRCRSDPVKMAALTTRLLDSPAIKVRIEERDEEEENSDDRSRDQCANSIVATEGEESRQVSQDTALIEQPAAKESGDSPTKSSKEELKGKENATADEEEQKQAAVEMPNESRLRRIQQINTVMRSSSCSSMADEKERTMSRRSQEGGRRHRRHSFSTEGQETWSFSIEKDGLKLEQEPMDQEKSKEGSLSNVGSKDDIFELPNTRRGKEEEEEEEEVTPMQDTKKLTNDVLMPTQVLALTRCKSEPIRSSSSFWRDRHRPIGATGVGS